MNEYYFVISKEHVELAKDEVISLIKTFDPNARIVIKDRLIIANSRYDLSRVAKRAVMIRYAGRSFDDHELRSIRRFGIKAISLNSKIDKGYCIDRLADRVKGIADNCIVDLSNPDVMLGIILLDKPYYCILYGLERVMIDKVYRHPAELEPRLARIMINLAMVKEHDTLLDPCCGTGTILLYASYYKINAIGCDISFKQCCYSSSNLKANNLHAEVINCDSTCLPIKHADAVASNMPYGRAASSYGRDVKELIGSILDQCKRICKRIVIMCKEGDEPDEYLRCYTLYVHSSLRRRLVVCN